MPEQLATQLRKTSNSILQTDDPEIQKLELIGLHSELESINGSLLWRYRDHTEIPQGTCIAPVEAGYCMLDMQRTVKFVRGLREAIKESQKRNPGKRISVLYAGCGPFATLALPMTTEFSPDEVGFTLVDIHDGSLLCVSKLINTLGLRAYFDDLVQADATKYKPKKQPDILLTETMGRALLYEPHLAITDNLKRFLSDTGILVPEIISLGAQVETLNTTPQKTLNLEDFFTLTKDSPSVAPECNIEGSVDLDPNLEENDLFYITITTRIRVFNTHVIDSGESMITHKETPYTLFRQTEGTRVNIKYPAGGVARDIQMQVLNSASEVISSE